MKCKILGAPVQHGAGRMGCDGGPEALRAAGLTAALAELGHDVIDLGDARPAALRPVSHRNSALKALPEISAWTAALAEAAYAASADAMPIFLGGDHSIAAGTVTGLARRARELGRPLFLLWLDAHPDFHTLDSSESGNLHGVPLAYVSGQPGFAGYFPDPVGTVDPARICLFGVRSIDPAEALALPAAGITVHDMRAIAKRGITSLIGDFLARVAAAKGLLHVSFDVDCLDPDLAPAVGTGVAGGVRYEQAQQAMQMLAASGLVSSLDLVELNPTLDEHGRTAGLMVDLTASLLSRRTLQRAMGRH